MIAATAPESPPEANREVNVADDDHQGHANRQHGDIANLVEQIAQISGRQKKPIRCEGKDDPNRRQGNIHAVFTDVFPQYFS
jgi:hypothetical protein